MSENHEAAEIYEYLSGADEDTLFEWAREIARYRAAFDAPDEAERVAESLDETQDGEKLYPGMSVWVKTSDGWQEDVVAYPELEIFYEIPARNTYAYYPSSKRQKGTTDE